MLTAKRAQTRSEHIEKFVAMLERGEQDHPGRSVVRRLTDLEGQSFAD
ncbi:MAG: YdeI/OmpD-associated family protein [Thermoleophilia bacterium]|nr:YdeI/OmpD-associated family protein [Thermoleophilia bacterium]